jgi:hypothetical protein
MNAARHREVETHRFTWPRPACETVRMKRLSDAARLSFAATISCGSFACAGKLADAPTDAIGQQRGDGADAAPALLEASSTSDTWLPVADRADAPQGGHERSESNGTDANGPSAETTGDAHLHQECATPPDCEVLLGPLSGICIACPNQSILGCEHYVCLYGICQTAYCDYQ